MNGINLITAFLATILGRDGEFVGADVYLQCPSSSSFGIVCTYLVPIHGHFQILAIRFMKGLRSPPHGDWLQRLKLVS